MKKFSYKDSRFFEQLEEFLSEDTSDRESITQTVRTILEAVRSRGDEAVVEYTKRFDGFSAQPEELRVDPSQLKAAEKRLTSSQRAAIRESIRCVREFHRKGLPSNWRSRNPHGAIVGERWYPICRVGIYIPAGNVPLVSTAVMTVTLAKLAGVPRIAVFTPASADGRISTQMLGGLSLCGVSEIYRIGGAQAIAAMAYGTESIERVNKIMGPGNAYVAEAQRQVFGTVGVDLLPGPSEALVISDATADPRFIAADLLAQAEHGSGRERIYFVYSRKQQADAVEKHAAKFLGRFKHAEAIRNVWENRACFIHVPSHAAAIAVANHLAPEHLELHVDKKHVNRYIREIHTAGAILCGHESPTVTGDFTAGPSHTLPTARTGHFFSGLKITDFMRRSSIVQYDKRSLRKARAVIREFSALEELDAHGYSCEVRFENSDGK